MGSAVFLVHWDLRESMRESDIEVIMQRTQEKYTEAKPRIISDNGPRSAWAILSQIGLALGGSLPVARLPEEFAFSSSLRLAAP